MRVIVRGSRNILGDCDRVPQNFVAIAISARTVEIVGTSAAKAKD